MKFLRLPASALLFCLSFGVLADYYDGLRLKDGGDTAGAVSIWKQAAAAGDGRAQFALGQSYESGDGVPQDLVQAYVFYTLAVTSGEVQALKARDALVKVMDDQTIRDAQKIAATRLSAGIKPAGQTTPALPDPPVPSVDLTTAAKAGDTKAVVTAIAAGQTPDEQDDEGWTPLMHASLTGNSDVVNALVGAGADVNAKGKNGETALMIAAFGGNSGVVGALLEAGANAKARNKEGLTAFELAKFNAHSEIVALLKRKSGPDKSLVIQVQRGLNELGYNAGPADGVPGAKTSRAIQSFQHNNGLRVDGKITRELSQLVVQASKTKPAKEQMEKSRTSNVDITELRLKGKKLPISRHEVGQFRKLSDIFGSITPKVRSAKFRSKVTIGGGYIVNSISRTFAQIDENFYKVSTESQLIEESNTSRSYPVPVSSLLESVQVNAPNPHVIGWISFQQQDDGQSKEKEVFFEQYNFIELNVSSAGGEIAISHSSCLNGKCSPAFFKNCFRIERNAKLPSSRVSIPGEIIKIENSLSKTQERCWTSSYITTTYVSRDLGIRVAETGRSDKGIQNSLELISYSK